MMLRRIASLLVLTLVCLPIALQAQDNPPLISPENADEIRLIGVHPRPWFSFDIHSIDYSADGALVYGFATSVDLHGELYIWDTSSWAQTMVSSVSGCYEFLPEGHRLAYCSGEQIVLLDPLSPDNAQILTPEDGGHVELSALDISADGTYLAVGRQNGLVEVWSLEGDQPQFSVRINTGGQSITALAFDQQNRWIAALDEDFKVYLTDLTGASGSIELERAPNNFLRGLQFTADGSALIGYPGTGNGGPIMLWNLETLVPTPIRLEGNYHDFTLSRDGLTALSGSGNSFMFLDVRTGIRTLWSTDVRPQDISLISSWNYGAVAAVDSLLLLDVLGGDFVPIFDFGARHVAIAPDGTSIVAIRPRQLWVFGIPAAETPELTLFPAYVSRENYLLDAPNEGAQRIYSHDTGDVSVVGRDETSRYLYVLDEGGWALNDSRYFSVGNLDVESLPIIR